MPLARLCVDKGLNFSAAAELFKRAYVHAARAALEGRHGPRDVSRVAAATGLTRREVTRLSGHSLAPPTVRGSPATQVFTRWMATRKLHDGQGNPLPLKRQGRAPSFEALAQSVTRDVHPRSLLDDLCRLGLARFDEQSDTVSLLRDAFAPHEDQARALGFLGSNVGDHLAAAVANISADKPPHHEQAIFADELSRESLDELRKLVGAQWKSMLTELVPKLQALIEADSRAGREARHRVRVGLYSYHAAMPTPPDSTPSED